MSLTDSLGRQRHESYERRGSDDTRDRSWVREAACRGASTSLFFPERGETTAEARAICGLCVVRAECREYGMGEHWGTWGGLSERARRQARRGRAG